MAPPPTKDPACAPDDIGSVIVHDLRDNHVALEVFDLREKSSDQAGIELRVIVNKKNIFAICLQSGSYAAVVRSRDAQITIVGDYGDPGILILRNLVQGCVS